MIRVRRLISLVCTCVLCLCLLADAQAVSYSDRGRYYLYITTADTETYSMNTQTNDDGTTINIYTAIGSLPAGTPISAGEVLDETYQKIVYMDQSSSTHTVIIRKDVIKGNYVTLDFGGSIGKVRIPRPAAANAGFIKDYLNYRGFSVSDSQINAALGIVESETTQAPVSEDLADEMNDTFPDAENTDAQAADTENAGTSETDSSDAQNQAPASTPAPETSSKSSTTKKSSSKATPTPTPAPRDTVTPDGLLYYMDDSGHMFQAELKNLGVARSLVTISGHEVTVDTRNLTWGTNAGENERLAVVNAPKAGSASLRKTSKKSSAVLKKITTGTVMRVFDIGETMTGVYVNGLTGYMLNSSITLMGTPDSVTTGRLSYKGSFTNTHRINFYSQARESSKKIKGVHAGDEVVIFSDTGTWTELDLDGFHGYILSKFVTPDEETAPLSDLSFLTGSVSSADTGEVSWEEETAEESRSDTEDTGYSEDTEDDEDSGTVSVPVTDSTSSFTPDKSQKDSNGYSMFRDPYN